MKKLLILALAAIGFAACETIDEGDRWTEATPVEMKKNVLVEDFTGQNCVNCPAAAELIHNLCATKMGEHIVAVSIHGGAMSMNANINFLGLATDLGEQLNKQWGVQAWPSGLIDRAGGIKDVPAWSTSIVQRMQKTPAVDIDLATTYDADARQLDITVSTTPAEGYNLSADHRINVWLTESGIESRQLFTDHAENEYVHNHVLREAITTDNILGNSLTAPTMTFSHVIPEGYGRPPFILAREAMPERMAVVVFITAPNGEVLQVVDAPVVK